MQSACKQCRTCVQTQRPADTPQLAYRLETCAHMKTEIPFSIFENPFASAIFSHPNAVIWINLPTPLGSSPWTPVIVLMCAEDRLTGWKWPGGQPSKSIRISCASPQASYLMFGNQRVITHLHSNINIQYIHLFTCLGYILRLWFRTEISDPEYNGDNYTGISRLSV